MDCSLENVVKKEFIEPEPCKYCGTMYYEVRSEGAPCGVDDCSHFHCCIDKWKEHLVRSHPDYYINEVMNK